ncbi:hypothetical protein HDU87_007589 [Geranomyces variabilis]|uniref:Uncharacterized protein n=1 Tax=Geranomyces variabilis TaxID=109894 RepID=A0AAD5XKB3_9FUNG|nr:hypothetical protein HDU87_007589 [Geranomyces variabilis]
MSADDQIEYHGQGTSLPYRVGRNRSGTQGPAQFKYREKHIKAALTPVTEALDAAGLIDGMKNSGRGAEECKTPSLHVMSPSDPIHERSLRLSQRYQSAAFSAMLRTRSGR